MEFDALLHTESGIDVGVIKGNGSIVFIKVGLGGDCRGFEEKYLRMAHRLHTRSGCSVLVASNPHDGQSHVTADRAIIEGYIEQNGINSPRLLVFGHSNGGVKALELCATGLPTARMVLVNMPLMINFHKTKRYLSLLESTKIAFVYGQLDPSFAYVPFLKNRYEHVTVSTVPGADHNFKDMTDAFVELCDALLT